MLAQRSQIKPFQAVARPLPVRRAVQVRASASRRDEATNKAPVVVSAAVVSAVAMSALVPAAQAAQEAFQMAEGEPFIVQLGWSAVAASFSFSLAMVVWGRSGM